MAILGNVGRSPKESLGMVFKTVIGFIVGFLLGFSFQAVNIAKFGSPIESKESRCSNPTYLNHTWVSASSQNISESRSNGTSRFLVSQSPRGAERLPPGIVVPTSDLYLRRLWGEPSEDLNIQKKYLLALTVGYEQKRNIDAVVRKFSNNFTVVLFHYDGRTTEWDEFEWSKQAIHISARKQTKWWYAKRFLHPDIVAQYEYIFIWDEDLGVEHFDAEEYLKVARKHGLEISQPSVESSKKLQWSITKRRKECEAHKTAEGKRNECTDPHFPPCAAFVEIMAPVFSRNAWRCVWHMIQNDLVHGWGLDFALWRCVEEPMHEKIGVVDSQWIFHQAIPSLGAQGQASKGSSPKKEVYMRCAKEWEIFQRRMTSAEKAFHGEELRSTNYTPQG